MRPNYADSPSIPQLAARAAAATALAILTGHAALGGCANPVSAADAERAARADGYPGAKCRQSADRPTGKMFRCAVSVQVDGDRGRVELCYQGTEPKTIARRLFADCGT